MIFNFFKQKPKVFAIGDLHFSSACNKPMDIFGGTWIDYEKTIEKTGKNKLVKMILF